MELDEPATKRQHKGSTDSDCDRRLFLKKNLSWTNSNSVSYSTLAKQNSLKTSRSNPHVLDANVKSFASNLDRLKLATSQLIPNRFQSQAIPSHSPNDDDVNNRRQLAPLAKAVSSSTLTAATTHQTLATPTSIQLNIPSNRDIKLCCHAVFRHGQVN